MEQKDQHHLIQKTLEELLQLLSIPFTIECQESADTAWFIIKTAESPLLIGEGGRNLAALNYLTRRILEKNTNEIIPFLIDINDYQRKRIDELKDTARMHAQRVRYFKKDIEMKPMNAYERRVIHMVLEEYPDIVTESVGIGPERRVVIKPMSMVS